MKREYGLNLTEEEIEQLLNKPRPVNDSSESSSEVMSRESCLR